MRHALDQMRYAASVLCLACVALASWNPPPASAQSLEDLVEDALRRHDPQAAPEPVQPPPVGVQDPSAPQIIPVEPGPRPYTPPAVATPTEPPSSTDSGAPSDAAGAPAPGTEQPAERQVASLTAEEVNAAVYVENAETVRGASPLILKAQVLLDRAGASPGILDSYTGANFSKAIAAVETVLGLPVDGMLDPDVWQALGGDQAPAVLLQYTITPEDVAYPFVASIPADFAEQAQLPSLGFTSAEEMFGERFHMHVNLLKALNPSSDFRSAGATIWVAAVEGQPITGTIARIEADKGRRQVRAYDSADRLVVAYPATIGSEQNPSPSGNHVVKAVAHEPVYYYDPANFVQGGNLEKLQLPQGPNSPVGTVWIDLSEPGYGIHGTPEPAKIDKTGSHGCVRLTNWDAEELAALVQPGVTVSFTE
jgi:lipoprotein-anchoring transpeptidase ErfK/SrfK